MYASSGTAKAHNPIKRFWKYVQLSAESECWLWTGGLGKDGYGKFKVFYASVRAHRFSYEAFVGPIPEGLQIDHLCKVRNCVNPKHLEAVTLLENLRRSPTCGTINAAKTHCLRGHPLSGENLILTPGHRRCRECKNIHKRARRQQHSLDERVALETTTMESKFPSAEMISDGELKLAVAQTPNYTSHENGRPKTFGEIMSRQGVGVQTVHGLEEVDWESPMYRGLMPRPKYDSASSVLSDGGSAADDGYGSLPASPMPKKVAW